MFTSAWRLVGTLSTVGFIVSAIWVTAKHPTTKALPVWAWPLLILGAVSLTIGNQGYVRSLFLLITGGVLVISALQLRGRIGELWRPVVADKQVPDDSALEEEPPAWFSEVPLKDFQTQRPVATQEELAALIIRDRLVRITDLIGWRVFIEGKTFERCNILGPAVLHLTSGTKLERPVWLSENERNNENFYIVVETDRRVYGVVGLNRCILTDCEFYRIAVIGDADGLKAWKQAQVK